MLRDKDIELIDRLVKLHRDYDKPAVIYANGRKEWWKNGVRQLFINKPLIKKVVNGKK